MKLGRRRVLQHQIRGGGRIGSRPDRHTQRRGCSFSAAGPPVPVVPGGASKTVPPAAKARAHGCALCGVRFALARAGDQVRGGHMTT